jgi:hypothetical protein
MATSPDYIKYVAAQVADCGMIRYKKMFGEYMALGYPAWSEGPGVVVINSLYSYHWISNGGIYYYP